MRTLAGTTLVSWARLEVPVTPRGFNVLTLSLVLDEDTQVIVRDEVAREDVDRHELMPSWCPPPPTQ